VSEAPEAVAQRLGLLPDPAAGWFAEAPAPQGVRRYRQLIAAGSELPWHEVAAEAVWRHAEGAPGIVSYQLPGGEIGSAQVRPGGALRLPAGMRQVVDTAGRWSLLEVEYRPRIRLTDRAFAPEDWHPDPKAPIVGTPLG
jgi:predicted cupin superfamily sugar epimerase